MGHSALPAAAPTSGISFSSNVSKESFRHGENRSPFGKNDKRARVAFTSADTAAFCQRNNFGLIVRSHQCVKHGFGYSLMHNGRLMRVFSARNYAGDSNNAAAML